MKNKGYTKNLESICIFVSSSAQNYIQRLKYRITLWTGKQIKTYETKCPFCAGFRFLMMS